MKKYLNLELIMTLLLLLIVAVIAFQGVAVEKLSSRAMQFPMFVFGMCFLFGIIEIVRNVKAVNQQAKAEGEVKRKPVFVNSKNFFVILGMIVAYAALVYLIGFVAATILLGIVYGFYSKYKNKWVVVIVAVCFSVAIYLLFTKVLGTSLPTGLIF